MDTGRSSCIFGAIVLASLLFKVATCAAQCPLTEFNETIQARNIDDVKAVEAQLIAEPICGRFGIAAVRQRAALEVLSAISLTGKGDERERLLVDADQPEVFWAASAMLGELRFLQKRFAEASRLFERAIEIIKNPSKTPVPPTEQAIKFILDRAMQSRQLTADAERANVGTYSHDRR
jgi:Flp pilus assembly protein TadD